MSRTTTNELLASITQSTPTMIRNCARCERALTDTASLEAGIGPICRRKDNALLARQIPSDLAEARTIVENRRRFLRGVTPEVEPILSAIVDDIRFGQGREDWRVTVKRMEWLLSTKHATGMLRETFYELAEALGYVALVSLWKGELAIGSRRPTTLSFDAQRKRLVLESVRPPATVTEKLRAIEGRRFEFARKAWTFPAHSHEAVGELVCRHFLAPRGVDEALGAARAHAEANPAPTPAPAAPHWRIEPLEGHVDAVGIRTPSNPRPVAELKAAIHLASRRRRYRAPRA